MPDPLILSASSVSTYLDCQYRYLLSSIYRLPGRQSMAAAIGTAVHAGVEALHKGDDPERALEASWVHEVKAMDSETILGENPEEARLDAHRMLATYKAKALSNRQPTMIEAPFIINVDGINVSGQIDQGDDRKDEVYDVKTRAGKTINGKKPSAFKGERHRFQLSVYGLAYKFLRGRLPKRLVIDSLTRRGTYTEYVIEPAYAEVPDLLGLTRDGILRGDFKPTGPSNGSCMYCPYFERECSFGSID